ncbi:porin OmpC [Citrobacter gillenii]|uniref:porin OmpC n=1 Tax=Citrobacter gillenii TaxID=67828 RepID=UPI001CB7BB39|nr:porin OmpC [Citrobacter sp. C1]
MIKHKLMSLAMSSVFLAGAAHAAEVYNKDGSKLNITGLISGERYFSQDPGMDGDQTYVRLGFRGETQISDKLTGYGQWQSQFDANNPESQSSTPRTRYGFAGLKFGDYGSLDYGRNRGVLYDSLGFTDMQPEFDAMTYGSDQFMFSRANGVATYRVSGFYGLIDGLDIAIQYQGKNDGGGEPGVRSVLRQNGDGYGMSATYEIGAGVSVVGAMSSANRTIEQNSRTSGIMGNGNRAEAYSGAVKYDANGVYLAAMYTQSYNASRFGSISDDSAYGYANKSQIIELYASYQFDFGLQPFVAYNVNKGKNLGRSASGQNYGDQDLIKFVDFGATYYFNKNINVFVDYMINLVDENSFTREAGISTDDVTAVGVVYQF